MGGTWVVTSWATHLGKEEPWGVLGPRALWKYEVVPVCTGLFAGCKGSSSLPPVAGEVEGRTMGLLDVFLRHAAPLAGAQA